MPGRKPCEVGCRCAKHPEGKLPPEEQKQKARERDAARDRREYNAEYYRADPEARRAYARERRASDPARAQEIDRRSKDKNRDKKRAKDRADSPTKRLRSVHGMTLDDVARMIEAQDGRCCYCERPLPADSKQVHIDHDHSCTCGPTRTCQHCRRGLACQNCNFVVGNAGDDPDRLEVIAANLRRLKAEASGRINTKPVQAELFDINEAVRRREESALWPSARVWEGSLM